MGQIVSVIRQCLPLCFPLPESEHQNEASQVVGIEDQIVASQVVGVQDQNEDEEAAEATAGEEDDDDVAFQANRDARVTVIARCEVDSMTDGCQWGIYEVTSPTKEYHITIPVYVCIVDPDCPVWKYVGRCSEDMSIHVTTYYGTHNHPLPVGSITAMASAASADFFRLLDSSNRLSEGTYSFTKASLPYDMNDPNDPSQGIVVDLTSQFPMPKSPVRDQDQNQPHKILLGECSKKEDAPQNLAEKL
ncbi:WRKY transcription factor 72B-like [Corylus avellana]|uniref:WRKY transcription factor 72B-like n=1 Tax=Corylus avellana TaxID=13451 RepID=UPI00286C98F6|nr:WRKY transcription factor 72B-like [Corylus avellana]